MRALPLLIILFFSISSQAQSTGFTDWVGSFFRSSKSAPPSEQKPQNQPPPSPPPNPSAADIEKLMPEPPPPVEPYFPPIQETPQDKKDGATSVDVQKATNECENCKYNKNFDDLQAVVNGKLKLADMTTWRRARGLVQIPTEGKGHSQGICGTTHYDPDSPGFDKAGFPTDNYAHPQTACALTAVLQEWKKNTCPKPDSGCRVFWGDISHPVRKSFNTHKEHTSGTCIDMRPMRKGGARNAPLYVGADDYDREMTRKFIELARSKGADEVIFNDRKIRAQRAYGHNNHMHICFRPSRKTQETCRNFKYDAAVCEKD